MAQKVQPQGLKSDGTLGTFRISDNNNLLVDFTPTSDDGLATAANQNTIIEDLETDGITLLPLSKDIDSIDVAKQTKGAMTIAHNAISTTTTSSEVDCSGFNSILIGVELSAAYNWTISIQGSMISGGTFKDMYEQANTGSMVLMSYQTSTNKMFLFKGIPDYIKVVATEDEDGATCTVSIQPLNM